MPPERRRGRLRYRRHVSADADSTADDAEAPLAAAERIAALDVLRGFALLGIFIMNMPGFSHSMFAAAECRRDGARRARRPGCASCSSPASSTFSSACVFGIGFAIQMARLDAAEAARAARLGDGAAPASGDAGLCAPARVPARRRPRPRRCCSGPATCCSSTRVLGFALLGLRRLGDRALLALIAACLALSGARPRRCGPALSAAASRPSRRSSTSSSRRRTTSPSASGSFLDAMRETARVFDWSWRSPFGLFMYAVVLRPDGDRHPGRLRRRPARLAERCRSPTRRAERRAPRAALAIAIGCGADRARRLRLGRRSRSSSRRRSRGRSAAPSLAACYALVVRAHRPRPPRAAAAGCARCATPAGCRSATTCCRRLLATFVFYGWGLGFWNSAGPAAEVAAGDRPLRRGPAAAQPPAG